MQFDSDFLAPYYARGDSFPNLLARSTYLGKYSRDGETWTDTIRRVVEGSCSKDPKVDRREAEDLFDAIWNGWILPPGRGLWTGGVPGIPAEASFNCWGVTIRSIEDWCWTADMLMLGGGVGVSLLEIDSLPDIQGDPVKLNVLCSKSHPDVEEVMPDHPVDAVDQQIIIDDTRNGWVSALRLTLEAAFKGAPLSLNLSSIRSRGTPIKTFGGIACGPGPLSTLCRAVWAVIRSAHASGRRLNSVDCLDITNHIGVCIKSGNVRRSAILILGEATDRGFREAKRDWNAVLSHRATSNNSIVFRTEEQIDQFDWKELVDDNAEYGEPGILNLWKIRQDDPKAEIINPCFRGDTLIHTWSGDFQIKDLVGKTAYVWDGKHWCEVDTFQKTSENEEMLKFVLACGRSFVVTKYHIVVTDDGQRIEAKDICVGTKVKISNAPTRSPGDWLDDGDNEIVRIEDAGIDEEVFCLVTEDPNQIALSIGIMIGRCGEIPLHNREACNLAEIFPALIPPDKMNKCLDLLTRYTLRQRLEPLKDPTAEKVRVDNMRIGVGLGGICDFDATEDNLADWSQVVFDTAEDYALDLGVSKPIAATTVKPSGTISLLNGSSPGIHAPYAPFYIRRTRISKQEPMAQALMDAGVPYEDCVYDSTGNTRVSSFPMKAKPGTTKFVTTESVKDQIERQVMVQKYWSNNAVSTTISFREDEKEELAALLKKYAKDLKSISCLPKKHNYQQPPYSEIDELTYNEMNARIDNDHALTAGGDLEIEDCPGGVCPVR